ncbi:hypothetical protein HELRODRAFT_159471 [Helobdella robusta]|uniref:C1q domain-containing protein n=1 Tax=Helobdella robusta TaxID=6412 RepID=T1EP26_HELRO|nr:hypothetical protein HELRODRAFT_159471 [Helobdella robusta]ESO12883.1 hypothetical protein HELRODRAFT_159471 [Helobdella robusta]
MGPVVERTTIKFDKIVTNFGSAYDSNTGIVTAPVRGVYHFTVIISAQSQQKRRSRRGLKGVIILPQLGHNPPQLDYNPPPVGSWSSSCWFMVSSRCEQYCSG